MITTRGRSLRAAAVAAALLAVAAVPTVALAAGTAGGPPVAPVADATPHLRPRLHAAAEALGVTPERLRAAIAEARAGADRPERDASPEERQAWKQAYLRTLAALLDVDTTALERALSGWSGVRAARPAAHLAAAAEHLDVSVEALQRAMAQARPDVAALHDAEGDPSARLARHRAYLTAVASELGADLEAVEEALGPRAKERRAEAGPAGHHHDRVAAVLAALVEEGRLTRAQAALVLERLEHGGPGLLRGWLATR
ncbi:MAG: hypothetical protein WD734_03305 [Dehalococcoidia bacterium]